MAPIATYVFFDLGTTGLLETKPKITELHMMAFNCDNLKSYFREGGEEYSAKAPPYEQLHCKRTDGVMMMINPEDEDEECILEQETAAFLDELKKPLCLIAHNGNKFDFPLLIRKLAKVEFSLKGMVFADSMAAFYDIDESNTIKTSIKERNNGSFPWPDYHYGKKSYKLDGVYKRMWGYWPNTEDAKERNRALVKSALSEGFDFMLWVAENNQPFTSFIEQNI